MKGLIAKVNRRRGMVAIRTEMGYSIFEHSGAEEVNVGDEVVWQGDAAMGDTFITNTSTHERFEVYFQSHHVLEQNLSVQLCE